MPTLVILASSKKEAALISDTGKLMSHSLSVKMLVMFLNTGRTVTATPLNLLLIKK